MKIALSLFPLRRYYRGGNGKNIAVPTMDLIAVVVRTIFERLLLGTRSRHSDYLFPGVEKIPIRNEQPSQGH